jgi:hypothetical protein
LGLSGGPTAQQEKTLDQAFLTEMMEVRERIEEAEAAGNRPADVAPIEADLAGREAALLGAVGAASTGSTGCRTGTPTGPLSCWPSAGR